MTAWCGLLEGTSITLSRLRAVSLCYCGQRVGGKRIIDRSGLLRGGDHLIGDKVDQLEEGGRGFGFVLQVNLPGMHSIVSHYAHRI